MQVDIAKYTLMRKALAESTDDPDDIEMIRVNPKVFPLKKQHAPEVLRAAMEILDDPRVMTGITPVDTIKSLSDDPGVELVLYSLVCYAVAVQQKWIRYSTLINKYILNADNKMALEYTQDIHKQKFLL